MYPSLGVSRRFLLRQSHFNRRTISLGTGKVKRKTLAFVGRKRQIPIGCMEREQRKFIKYDKVHKIHLLILAVDV